MRKTLLPLITALGLAVAGSAMAQDSDSLVSHGKYIATAGDCAACHGDDLSGGLGIESPMGKIYASNITFDGKTGIGNWTEQQFADALRKGRAPGKGWLYPAMPYTSYTGLSDDDVKALYAYIKSIPAVDHKVPETRLPFPFMRAAMIGWNMLNLHDGTPDGQVSVQGDQLKRGQYLVETLGHCSTCHTPRNTLMGEVNSKHLAGGQVGTWIAPNITPAKDGIGDWSDAELKQFLKTGNARNQAAAGDMGLAVEHSFSHLSDADLTAMVAYLRKVPAVSGTTPHAPAAQPGTLDVAALEQPSGDWKAKAAASDVSAGGTLYMGACSTCHGLRGEGTPDGSRPMLLANDTARALSPNNLIQVITHGIDRKTPTGHAYMPEFGDQMSDAQIASLATYVRGTLNDVPQPQVSAAMVKQVRSDAMPANWLIANAATLAWIAIVVAVIIVLLIIAFVVRARSRHTRV